MEKLLAIVNLGQEFYGRWLFRRLLISFVLVMSLVFTLSMMVSALLVSTLYVAYAVLLYFGSTPLLAMTIVGALSIIIILVLGMFTLSFLRRLHQMSQMPLNRSPIASHAIDILGAFADGFMAKK